MCDGLQKIAMGGAASRPAQTAMGATGAKPVAAGVLATGQAKRRASLLATGGISATQPGAIDSMSPAQSLLKP